MNWLKKTINQVNRVFGLNVSEDASEAELNDALESVTPLTQQIEANNHNNSERISALEEANNEFASSSEVSDLRTQATQMTELIKGLTETVTALKTSNENLVNEINNLKLNKPTNTTVPATGAIVQKPSNEENENEMTVSSAQLFDNAELVRGLGI